MNKIFMLVFFIFIKVYIQAHNWEEYWIKAVEHCDKKEYASAKEMFDLAINCLEENEDSDHPFVYVDRGRLNLLLENNELALADLDKALSNEKLTKSEKSKAVVSRMMTRSRLGMESGVLEDLKLFAQITDNKPIFENTKEYIIIRNVPDCSCYENIMTCYFIHSGICLNKNDIQKLSSGVWIIKKNCGCKDFDEQHEKCDDCHSSIKAERTQDQISSCKGWCDRMAVAAISWCTKVFKTTKCQSACALAVNEICNICNWCCEAKTVFTSAVLNHLKI